MFTDIVILAGGSGTRLWPASVPSCPKQFMTLENGLSFLQTAVYRALLLEPEGSILIITRADLERPVIEDCRHLAENLEISCPDYARMLREKTVIILEPCARSTAPALALACRYAELRERDKTSCMLVMTSDHVISPAEAFLKDAEKAALLARGSRLVCFAVPPNGPSPDYGYMKGEPLPPENGGEAGGSVLKIVSFREKPDEETATRWLAEGGYYWNSGMYAFRCDFFMKELEKHQKEIIRAFSALGNSFRCERKKSFAVISHWDGLAQAYGNSPSISADYAVSEKCSDTVAVKVSFSWDDVGNWDAFSRCLGKNSAHTVSVESSNNFIYSDIPVALCGVNGLIVVIKNGQSLVLQKGKS